MCFVGPKDHDMGPGAGKCWATTVVPANPMRVTEHICLIAPGIRLRLLHKNIFPFYTINTNIWPTIFGWINRRRLKSCINIVIVNWAVSRWEVGNYTLLSGMFWLGTKFNFFSYVCLHFSCRNLEVMSRVCY